jgi:hypothetical protein
VTDRRTGQKQYVSPQKWGGDIISLFGTIFNVQFTKDLILCPFELRNIPKFTTEAACQCISSETTEQNFMKLGK